MAFEPVSPASELAETPVATTAETDSLLGGESACDGSCSECDSCCDPGLFGGLIKPTSSDFGCFISPMTNPVYFEDPRTLTEARVIFVDHTLPAGLGGGSVRLLACQFRAALSDRLSIIATKDGFFFWDNPPLPGVNDGWSDVNVGLKYNLYSDPGAQQILSAGLTFELPVGSPRALQGNGDGMFNMFLSGGTQFAEQWRYVSAAGLLLPSNGAAESQLFYWSNHVDRQIGNTGWYLLGEANWYHYTRSGNAAPFNFEGLDVFNFGSNNVAGNDIVTGALGLKYSPSYLREYGICYEVPLTERKDVLQSRLTIDAIFRF